MRLVSYSHFDRSLARRVSILYSCPIGIFGLSFVSSDEVGTSVSKKDTGVGNKMSQVNLLLVHSIL